MTDHIDHILPLIYANKQRCNDDQRVAMNMTLRATSHSVGPGYVGVAIR